MIQYLSDHWYIPLVVVILFGLVVAFAQRRRRRENTLTEDTTDTN